ncbi:ATP-binding protein [Cellvibrio japonicus]|uniref:histidine kinase n=1 Tax=Cellvibrio japonicus (strain Ueda107) TaxID=498211 RepID=B3PKM4_CELJU|nr:ATP-binding protein [Cellvibrio japonicus]ACE86203.1 Sensory transduction histidine kinase [Cellvibrio japonicus Ueda107]QEI11435.1 HAMP domain-containing protein [Cellvibrio japonicus]QEI15009.1 HAMP domain-containing protein [Cellvibrio japonicus]QEI18589.1 HAMP domain-containing protein [Cellvibrio japonicus]
MDRARFSSIAARLLFASALLLPLFLGLTGFFLDRAFSNSLEVAVHSRLRGHINLLFSVAELHESRNGNKSELRLPLTLREADFEQPNSGLYAYIFNDKRKLEWSSNSAALISPPDYSNLDLTDQPGQMVFSSLLFQKKPFFAAHYDVYWEDNRGRPHPYRFLVMLSASEYEAELSAYRNQLWRWLGAAGVFLLLSQILILRWGLRPLGKLARALKAMQSGDTSTIEGEHPRELQKVVDNLNQVLVREQSLRQRYRNSLADLAHSLKTPLAVLQSKLGPETPAGELQQIAAEQVARMSQVVTYQLQRAVSSQQAGTTRRTRLEPIAQRLLSALQKVYADKHIQPRINLAGGSVVAGDEQDIMELLGNILENAFKYGHSQVHLSSELAGDCLCICIEDDGPGVPPEERLRILQRGQRLDTNKPGQGIGLAVAAEIVSSYEGRIDIDESSLGGARFRVFLPLLPV